MTHVTQTVSTGNRGDITLDMYAELNLKLGVSQKGFIERSYR